MDSLISSGRRPPYFSRLVKHLYLNKAGETPTFVLESLRQDVFDLEIRCYDQREAEVKRSVYELTVNTMFLLALREAIDSVLGHQKNGSKNLHS